MTPGQAGGEHAGELDFIVIQRLIDDPQAILECLAMIPQFVLDPCDALAARRQLALPVKLERPIEVAEALELARDFVAQ
jgi:hypothetical protein